MRNVARHSTYAVLSLSLSFIARMPEVGMVGTKLHLLVFRASVDATLAVFRLALRGALCVCLISIFVLVLVACPL